MSDDKDSLFSFACEGLVEVSNDFKNFGAGALEALAINVGFLV
jgi:hypothetical protein